MINDASLFSMLSPTDSLFYPLFFLNIILCGRKCKKKVGERERVCERKKGRGRKQKKK
jgi:hypothetical protein